MLATMPPASPPLLRLAAPAARAAVRQMTRLAASPAPAQRHPLVPAAVRVERSQGRDHRGRTSELTAVTVWLGEGPALPGGGAADPLRAALRVGTSVVGAAAIAAVGVLAARQEGWRARLAETPPAPRLRQGQPPPD